MKLDNPSSMSHNERNDTTFLRFLAIALILNSHLGTYYPIDHIGTGGAIGNSIFFMLSSFGLFLSEQNKSKTFQVYYQKRISRIYPTVWTVLLFLSLPMLIITKGIDGNDVMKFMGYFFYPPFWFLKALMVYYFFGYFLIKKYSTKNIICISLLTVIIYIIFYSMFIGVSSWSIENPPMPIENLPFKLIFYQLIFIYGLVIAKNNSRIKYQGKIDFYLFIFFLLCMYYHKFLMSKGLFINCQFLQHVFMFPLLFFIVKISRSSLINKLMNIVFVSSFITWVSSITLEIYMVHIILQKIKITNLFFFPYNLIVFLVSTLIICWIINHIAMRMRTLVFLQ